MKEKFHFHSSLSSESVTLETCMNSQKLYSLIKSSSFFNTTQKMKFLIKVSSVNVTKSEVSCEFGHITEEILNGKLHFLHSVSYITWIFCFGPALTFVKKITCKTWFIFCFFIFFVMVIHSFFLLCAGLSTRVARRKTVVQLENLRGGGGYGALQALPSGIQGRSPEKFWLFCIVNSSKHRWLCDNEFV